MNIYDDYEVRDNELVFSLDIGTRTVIGIVGKYENDEFTILDTEILEHKKRSMYDGQIHDISGVVEIVNEIKENLEKRLNIKLDKVAIAAAGRALKTCRVKVDREEDISKEIDRRIVESLEMEAIQKAQQIIDNTKEKNKTSYYCVGYSVVNYFLDDGYIEDITGHKGRKIGADIIATFLPHVVVDSLYTVMDKVGLEVTNITLEPIAAINVAIKKSLRLLNLALVDIGAGTSDIAITKDGNIIAYGMASVAGDEITEAIAKKYLLDYDTAESIKVKLNTKEKHEFVDVVGISHVKTTEDIIENIKGSISELAKQISDTIIKYNQKSPSAIFLIGGGSQIPTLGKHISQLLDLPEERVVIRDTTIVEKVVGINEKISGPNAITPIGIAITAIKNKSKDFLEITLNNKKMKLFNSRQLKVSDALILIGYNPRNLLPKKGKDTKYYLNNKIKKIPGIQGEPSEIFVNGNKVNLQYKIQNGDNIEVKNGTEGSKKEVKLFDILNKNSYVSLNGEKRKLIEKVKVNGKEIDGNTLINDNDRIETIGPKTISDLLEYSNEKIEIHVNGENKDNEYILKDKDEIEISKAYDKSRSIHLIINGEDKYFNYDKKEFIFVDIFNHIDFDLSKPKGQLVLLVNGNKANYHQKLHNGDKIDIYWNS